MFRPKLRVRTGCNKCKRRRVKCDEVKPVCEACQRLRITCDWPKPDTLQNTGRPPRREPPCPRDTRVELVPPTARESNVPLRIGDYDLFVNNRPVSWREVSGSFSTAELFPASTTDFAKCFDEHVTISGIFLGWDVVRTRFHLDPQWDPIIQLDEETKQCGHGPVARMAAIWCWRMMMKYQTAPKDKPYVLPQWYIPRPGVRERLIGNVELYSTNDFLARYMVEGFRFLWPFRPHEAFIWDQSQYMMQASPEFVLRINNLRSFTMTRDFLAQFPEFIGEAPQLEPSPTMYGPSIEGIIEGSYWAMLRQRMFMNLSHRPKAHSRISEVEEDAQNNETSRSGTERQGSLREQ